MEKKKNASGCELRRASKRRRETDPPIDRLSHLPDSVLYHILSLLDTRAAVQTSVLSRRWRCSWKYVSDLWMHPYYFGFDVTKFETYVDKVLSLRYPLNVRKLSYHHQLEDKSDNCLLRKVIQCAFSHETKHLAVNVGREPVGDDCILPELFDSISDCSLETLELVGFLVDGRFSSSNFRVLTTLELVWCEFWFDEEILDPFSGFPSLRNLVLNSCSVVRFVTDGRLRISGLQLRNLELLNMILEKVEIFAPELKSLRLSNVDEGLEFSEITLPSLDHVYVQVTLGNEIVEEGDTTKEQWVVMFQGFHNVKSLTLSSRILKALCGISEFLEQQHSPFTRLKVLNLVMNSNDIPYNVVNYFLKGSASAFPSIKVLKENS